MPPSGKTSAADLGKGTHGDHELPKWVGPSPSIKRRESSHVEACMAHDPSPTNNDGIESDKDAPVESPEDGLRSRFSLIPADSADVQNEVFRLRHQIFCEEFRLFEPRPDGMERDDFDRHSLFLLLRSARTNEPVGCVRVVMTDPESPYSLLPFEKACGSMLERIVLDPAKLPRNSIGEVSRLGVAAKFRRRKGEQKSPAPLADDALQVDPARPNPRQFPYILVSLYLGSIALAEYSSLSTLFTFTELRLVSHFAKLGVPIKPINSPVDHKGIRLPCVLDVKETIQNFSPFVRGVYNEIRRQIVDQRQHGATAVEISTGQNL